MYCYIREDLLTYFLKPMNVHNICLISLRQKMLKCSRLGRMIIEVCLLNFL